MTEPNPSDPRKRRRQRHQNRRDQRNARRVERIDRHRDRITTKPRRRWGRLTDSNDTDNGSSADDGN